MDSALRPRRLKRRTRFATVLTLLNPARRAASAKLPVSVTVSSARARRTRSTRSLLALVTPSKVCRSPSLKGRKGSFCTLAMALSHSLLLSVSAYRHLDSSYLRHDPLVVDAADAAR